MFDMHVNNKNQINFRLAHENLLTSQAFFNNLRLWSIQTTWQIICIRE